jgi:hypothetical protein
VMRQAADNAAESVLPGVSDHAWTSGLAPVRKDAEERPEDGDNSDHAEALVDVRGAEQERREDDARGSIAGECDELALEITAEESFFANAGGRGDNEPNGDFHAAAGKETEKDLVFRIDAEQPGGAAENDERDDPEAEGEADVAKELLSRLPALAEDKRKRRAVAADSPDGEAEEEPFEKKSDDVEAQAVGTRRGGKVVGHDFEREAPGGQGHEQKNCVEWASDGREASRRGLGLSDRG